jgi:uncharacterized protein YodC (DUF2158 family)
MTTQFKIGDVVTLKSGGPPMTVISTICDCVGVSWFDGNLLQGTSLVQDAVEFCTKISSPEEPQKT